MLMIRSSIPGEGFAMEGSIFIMQPDNSLVKVNRTPYNSEALLQGLLSEYPDLLAGDQMNTENPRRWLLISPELGLTAEADGTGGWWIDHLFLDQDAIPTIVEVKRSSDSRIRREVVGQMLDYAAHLEVYWPAERIRASFEERCRAHGTDPDRKVGELVQEEEPDIAGFWARVGENLSIGKMRLLFVADEMPVHLQRVVEFLNKYLSPVEVLAVEIKQFEGSNLKTLVPRVLGQTVQTQQKTAATTSSTSSKRHQNAETFFAELTEARPPDEVSAVRRLYEWAQEHDVVCSWGTSQIGSMIPIVTHKGVKHYFGFFWTNGKIYVDFRDMRPNPPFSDLALREKLLARLEDINGAPFPPNAVDRQPSITMSAIATEDGLAQFLDTFAWYVDTIRAS
jgi:hypothetical protein